MDTKYMFKIWMYMILGITALLGADTNSTDSQPVGEKLQDSVEVIN